jgi:rare lipoprotein A
MRRMKLERYLKRGAILAAAALAAACGSLNPFGSSRTDAPAPAQRSEAPAPQASRPAPAQPPVVQRRGGAYYQDDGPGDNAPPNLELTPDAVPKDEPPLRSATNRTYVVFGKTYTPITDNRPLHQRGIGSWYGRKFHGQKTSSGEPYDMYAMTAAHPTLPIPSYVRVTNVANGKSVVVKVNDRGPFHSDRIIDLSYTAALKLDYVNQGSTLVDVVRVREGDRVLVAAASVPPPGAAPPAAAQAAPAAKPAPTNASRAAPAEKPAPSAAQATPIEKPVAEPATIALPTATQPDGVYLQIGAFGARENAESFRTRVAQQLAWLTETIYVVPGNNLHRLQVGPYRSRDDANKIAEKIRETLQLKPVFVLR